ncbi:hypothetical protein OQA88_5285 [Cercophora sp. LCS_1]
MARDHDLSLAESARIRPVLFKLVDSVHLHVVNTDQTQKSTGIPEALQSLDAYYMGNNLPDIVKSIQELSSKKLNIFMEMSGYIVDVVDWVLHHWQGKLTISLDSTIVLDEQLGEAQMACTLMISPYCEDPNTNLVGKLLDGSWHSKPAPGVRIASGGKVGEKWPNPASSWGATARARSGADRSQARTGLYQYKNPLDTEHMRLTKKERNEAHRCAQDIIRSLIELPVEPMALGKWLVLTQVRDSKTKFGSWQNPSILQTDLGQEVVKTRLLYLARRCSSLSSRPGVKSKPMVQHKPSEVVGLYEELGSGLQLVEKRCECGCKGYQDDEESRKRLDGLNSGCLCTVMLVEMVLMIGNAMAEASGAVDVSQHAGEQAVKGMVKVVMNLLGSIATRGQIRWESWLSMTSMFIGGVCMDDVVDTNPRATGPPRAKWQTLFHVIGSMTIAPKWFQLDSPIQPQGSWAVQQLDGVPFGIQADIAAVEVQESTKVRFRGSPTPVVPLPTERLDTSEVTLESMVFSNSGDTFQMGFLVKSNEALRIFNPIDSYIGLIEATVVDCEHDTQTPHPYDAELHIFSDVLQRWNASQHDTEI